MALREKVLKLTPEWVTVAPSGKLRLAVSSANLIVDADAEDAKTSVALYLSVEIVTPPLHQNSTAKNLKMIS